MSRALYSDVPPRRDQVSQPYSFNSLIEPSSVGKQPPPVLPLQNPAYPPGPPLPSSHAFTINRPPKKSRNVVILLDGTANKYGDRNSNVLKLMEVIQADEAVQLVYYSSGFGEPVQLLRTKQRISQDRSLQRDRCGAGTVVIACDPTLIATSGLKLSHHHDTTAGTCAE